METPSKKNSNVDDFFKASPSVMSNSRNVLTAFLFKNVVPNSSS